MLLCAELGQVSSLSAGNSAVFLCILLFIFYYHKENTKSACFFPSLFFFFFLSSWHNQCYLKEKKIALRMGNRVGKCNRICKSFLCCLSKWELMRDAAQWGLGNANWTGVYKDCFILLHFVLLYWIWKGKLRRTWKFAVETPWVAVPLTWTWANMKMNVK